MPPAMVTSSLHHLAAVAIFGSVLETVHAALALTGGGPMQAFTQWFGRTLVFVLVRELPAVQACTAGSSI